jgi:hypothetical protein
MLYSLDLRIRVINAVKSGGSKVAICKVFNIVDRLFIIGLT